MLEKRSSTSFASGPRISSANTMQYQIVANNKEVLNSNIEIY